MQIYKKESKSQQIKVSKILEKRCDYLCKYIKKKANHNMTSSVHFAVTDVITYANI